MTNHDLTRRSVPVVLAILDGWGVGAAWSGNALAQAHPLHFTRLWHEFPHRVLEAIAPADVVMNGVGGSDTGHASIGTGRQIASDIADISTAIVSGSFFSAPSVRSLTERVAAERSSLHLIGLVSSGALHSHLDHLYGFLEAARRSGLKSVFVHAITDGIDVVDGSARRLISELQHRLHSAGVGTLASVSGRAYAMDRSEQWARTRAAFQALTGRRARHAPSLDELWSFVEAAHESDAEILPTVLTGSDGAPLGPVRPNDVAVFWNVRRDRMVQLVRAFADPRALALFGLVRREPLAGAHVRTLTDYQLALSDVEPLFTGAVITESLGRILSDHGIPHARVYTTDREAHMTYYLNGGQSEPFAHETRVVVPVGNDPVRSPAGATIELANRVTQLVRRRHHSVIVVNYDAVDRCAHTGNVAATIDAIRAVDRALGTLSTAVSAVGGTLLVTADHGNAESMLVSRSGRRHTAHGVPFILGLPQLRRVIRGSATRLALPLGLPDGRSTLADITPTILALFGIAKPSSMSGRSLLPSRS